MLRTETWKFCYIKLLLIIYYIAMYNTNAGYINDTPERITAVSKGWFWLSTSGTWDPYRAAWAMGFIGNNGHVEQPFAENLRIYQRPALTKYIIKGDFYQRFQEVLFTLSYG